METDDPVKGELLEKVSQHRQELEDEVKEISDRTEKILTNAAIVGGALALSYLLFRQFSQSKKTKSKSKKKQTTSDEQSGSEEENSSIIGDILTDVGTRFANEALTILLSIAREKLSEYLQSQSEKKQNEHSK
jgi:hypothetical protein